MPSFSPLFRVLILSCLLLGAASFSGPAEAKILEGDWESAGAPVMPYDPDYQYAYACQAQLTDGEAIMENGDYHQLYAVAKFELNNSKSYASAKDLKWFWVKEAGEEETVVPEPKVLPFRLEGISAGLFLRPGSPDLVTLTVNVELELGKYALSESGQSRGDRNTESFVAKAKAHAYRARGASKKLPQYLARKFLVRCDKIR